MGGAEAERTRPDQRLPKRDGVPGQTAAAEDETRDEAAGDTAAGDTAEDTVHDAGEETGAETGGGAADGPDDEPDAEPDAETGAEAGDELVAGQTLVDGPSPRVPKEGWTAELPAPSGGDGAEDPEDGPPAASGPEATRPAPLPAAPPEDEAADAAPEPAAEPAAEPVAEPVAEAEATRPAPLPSVPRPAEPAEPADPADATAPAPLPAPEPAAPAAAPSVPAPRPSPSPSPAPAPPVQGGTSGAAAPGESPTWHRQHYTVGVFLLAYGVMSLISGALLWGDRREEVGDYFASGPSGAILVLAKAVQVLLVLLTAAAVARRRDTWFVPPLAGWMAGFALFAVLDVFNARWGGLLEHLLYLAGFVILLFLSYGLSAKAQVGGAARRVSGPEAPPEGLTRTQELALAAINRLPRR
ncbi:hypothetical protein [Actinomadura sp. WAC 06369]|uniref:hypothetical protein n=1 Tax=Actinomadura sp. WAC 06369 TaxID=2203193 RepID=UPI000F76917D|nr:hypothetical protein [Actinomadura sp. WAC 06369]RSN54087.1 hypothetical protein DMH08_27060 [Actinomadura sp. WAC 06369]